MDVEAKIKLKKIFPLGKGTKTNMGHLFKLKGYPNRLLKIITPNSYPYTNATKFIRLMKSIKINKNKAIAKIYDYGTFSTAYDDYMYYVMEKLIPLDMDEWSQYELIKIIDDYLYDKHLPPKFLDSKVKNFIINAKKFKYKYKDLHEGNIMLDSKKNYKFIDVESFI